MSKLNSAPDSVRHADFYHVFTVHFMHIKVVVKFEN